MLALISQNLSVFSDHVEQMANVLGQMAPRDLEDVAGCRSLHGHAMFGASVKALEEKFRPCFGWGPITKMVDIGWVSNSYNMNG